MKKLVLSLFVTFLTLNIFGQSRYLDEVFTGVTTTDSVVYGQNFNFITGTPVLTNLVMTVYEPTDDQIANRPLVIYIHTGSFLPILINQTPTGDMHDSATVEMCKDFARRGYVAISMDYRLGWNPAAGGVTGQDIRTGTLLQAVYRALQDTKTCVRYFKMTAQTQGNPWRIDTDKIIINGQGSGGYIALAYATLQDLSEINLPKFIATNDVPGYGIFANQPYVLESIWGDPNGFGGDPTLNVSNWPGYTNNIRFMVNMGGALGDSTWMEAGDVPMVCFHVPNDPFAPYDNGPVFVPGSGQYVVDVSGSHRVIRIADSLGNNSCFNLPFTDPYSLRANMVNDGYYGLFPFVLPPNPNPLYGGIGQAGPWEWWSLADLENLGGAALADPANANGLITNPDMSKTKALNYIDSIHGYLNPRIVACLNLDTTDVGIGEIDQHLSVNIFPNPATNFFTLTVPNSNDRIQFVKLFDVSGKIILEMREINKAYITIDRQNLPAGLYTIKIGLSIGEITEKVVLQ